MAEYKQKCDEFFKQQKIEVLTKIKQRVEEMDHQCAQLLLVAEYDNVMRQRVWAELKECADASKVASIMAREQARFKALAMDVKELQGQLREPIDLSDDLCSKLWRVKAQIENYSSVPEFIRTCKMPTNEEDRERAKQAIKHMWPKGQPMPEDMIANWRK